jgi:hypothetical protein
LWSAVFFINLRLTFTLKGAHMSSYNEERVERLVLRIEEIGLGGGTAAENLIEAGITHVVDLAVRPFNKAFEGIWGINYQMRMRIRDILVEMGLSFGMKEIEPDVIEARRRLSLKKVAASRA